MSHSYLKYLFDISKSRCLFNLRKIYRRESKPGLPQGAEKHLHNLRNDGFSIIENYWSEEHCRQLREKMDRAVIDYPSATWTGVQGADKRIFGIENIGAGFWDFFNDAYLLGIGSHYFGCRMENLLTLSGRIDAVEGNIGSGEGWHRDGNHFQFKVLVYLSDAGRENGPFQFIKGSHRYAQVIADNYAMKLEDPLASRFTDANVDAIIARQPERLVTFSAKAGTVVLIDVSGIHRGSPIKEGRRYSLFNYYYPYYDMAGRKEKFTPNLSPEMVGIAA